MSYGDQISDMRTNITNDCGPALIGEYFRRTWSGGNFVENELIPDHPYTTTISSSYNPAISWRFSNKPTGPFYSGSLLSCFGGAPGIVSGWSDNDELKLLNKAADKIRGSNLNLGNFIGESHQTVALIANTATRIAKGLHYLRNGNFYKASKEFGGPSISQGHVLEHVIRKKGIILNASDYADLVLEYQYGWRPLLSDVHGAAHSLANRLNVPFKTKYKVSRMTRSQQVIAGGGLVNFTCSHTKRVRLMVVLNTRPTLNTALHLNDPLSVAWEVMPWSFVADWFLPIGDYLGAVDFYRSFDINYIVRSEKTIQQSTFHSQGPGYEITGAESYYSRNVDFKREINSNPSTYADIPTPSFKSMQKALTPEHLLNAFALLTSTTDGIRKSLKF